MFSSSGDTLVPLSMESGKFCMVMSVFHNYERQVCKVHVYAIQFLCFLISVLYNWSLIYMPEVRWEVGPGWV